jgi:hypothetical protein
MQNVAPARFINLCWTYRGRDHSKISDEQYAPEAKEFKAANFILAKPSGQVLSMSWANAM